MSDARTITTISPFSTCAHGVRLHETSLTAIAVGSDLWRDLMTGQSKSSGAMFGIYQISTDEDIHSSQWERHPFSDELVGIFSGAMTLFVDDTSDFSPIKLVPLSAVIIPAGIWHRFEVTDPALLFTLSHRNGTELREVNNG